MEVVAPRRQNLSEWDVDCISRQGGEAALQGDGQLPRDASTYNKIPSTPPTHSIFLIFIYNYQCNPHLVLRNQYLTNQIQYFVICQTC